MTEAQLQAIEARVKRGYIFDRPGEVVMVPEDDTLALLAEVIRLKGLVEAAYQEALNGGPGWRHSDAKRQLEDE